MPQERARVSRRSLLRGAAVASTATAAAAACTPSGGSQSGVPFQEWHVRNWASELEVAGYVDRPSLNAGGDVTLHLNCTGADAGRPVQVSVYRTGWYAGIGALPYLTAAEVVAPAEQPGVAVVDPVTKRCAASWAPALTISTRTGGEPWPSGAYVILLTSSSGRQAYVPFTLRDDDSTASVLVVQSHLTWQAYNTAGGHDLYHEGAAVGFDRPYITDSIRRSQGAGEYFWLEYRVVRWLERTGVDVTYVSDLDLHRRPVPASTKVILLSGHSEYWTADMRRHVEEAMASRGVGLVTLGANTCYWRGRMEGSTAHTPGRYVLWKSPNGDTHPLDPLAADPEQASILFRRIPGGAEQLLLGGQFRGWLDLNAYSGPRLPSTALVAHDVSHPTFSGTGITAGQSFPGLCGGEYDWQHPQPVIPDTLHKAFRTPLDWRFNSFHNIGSTEFQESTFHEKQFPGGVTSRVFNAGTYTWAWGLDDFSFEPYTFSFADASIQALTSNILRWAAKEL